jgi:hypothetical protein
MPNISLRLPDKLFKKAELFAKKNQLARRTFKKQV